MKNLSMVIVGIAAAGMAQAENFIEGGRAFSFVIDEATGRMTASVARDGFSVSVFGVCTDTDL